MLEDYTIVSHHIVSMASFATVLSVTSLMLMSFSGGAFASGPEVSVDSLHTEAIGAIERNMADAILPPSLDAICDASEMAVADSTAQARMTAVGNAPITIPRYKGKNLVRKLIDYINHTNDPVPAKKFAFDILGGPYYSSDVQFAVAVVGQAQYGASRTDTLSPLSGVALKVQLSTTLFYSVGVSGEHVFPSDRRRLRYNLKFQSLPTYFWGVGYHNAINDIKSNFRETSLAVKAEYLERLGHHFYIGPSVELKYIHAGRRHGNMFLWDGQPLETTSTGIGLTAQLDTRDVATDATKGVFVRFSQRFFPRFMGNGNHSFSGSEITVNWYQKLWKGGVLATQLHGNVTYGKTPWAMMPTFGDGSMRGYYTGRYRDKCESDITLELRQHVWKRSGIVVWGGFGTVASSPKYFNSHTILPNVGIGYRFEFKKHVNLRLDVGFGKRTWGFEFNMGEVF